MLCNHYELYTPPPSLDLSVPSSAADLGHTSPTPKSPLHSLHIQAKSIRAPINSGHISKKFGDHWPLQRARDTPYHRHSISEPFVISDSILDMRLCSSPSPSQLVPAASHAHPPGSGGKVHNLPSHTCIKDAIRRISPQTMVDLLDNVYRQYYDELIIVDCRYPYEYSGGHIPGALNINTPDSIDRLLLENPIKDRHACIVFHCEFSSQRAPRMALHVRNFDRLLNSDRYPHLYYPEIYILDGGYKAFYDQFAV